MKKTSMHRSEKGFTLGETFMAVVIISILAAVAIPMYTRAVERAHYRGAQNILQTIYTGEQVYFQLNDSYKAIAVSSDWQDIYLDDPNPIDSAVTYTVAAETAAPPAPQWFRAQATRTGGAQGGNCMAINETNVIVACAGGAGLWTKP